jgi:hypothetical protein
LILGQIRKPFFNINQRILKPRVPNRELLTCSIGFVSLKKNWTEEAG